MLQALYLAQKAFDMKDAMRYSVGLVIICLLVLVLLWLPDMLKKD